MPMYLRSICRRHFVFKIFILLTIFVLYLIYKAYNTMRIGSNQIVVVNIKPGSPDSIAEQHVVGPVDGADVVELRVPKEVSPDRPDFPTKATEMNRKFEALIKADEDNFVAGLGEDGKAVQETPFSSSKEVSECIKKEAFNRILSDKISYTRRVPDARHSLCSAVTYDSNLPSASVIIIFIDEAWSSLMRTIHTALIRSPKRYLKEIVLVDDASTREELKGKLDYYIKTRLPENVKLIRLNERNGLIKARLAGAKAATGDVLVFLDSHCECGIDWLQPMLQRIKRKRNAVVCPIIDVIDDKTLGYMFSESRDFQIGSFTWSGHFTWIPIPEFEIARRKSEISATRSPTMAGGLFAIDRDYFWQIGSYDSEMEVWGGENLEMSFRIWQCGGSLEITPCSRVGHIFRSFHPYTFPGQKDTHGINTARMAEVWMDDYKRLFYMHRPDLKEISIGDITSRRKLRDKLKCRDFNWFLQNVVPQKFVLDENVKAYGRVKSIVKYFCFDNLNHAEDVPHPIGIYNCHDKLYNTQYFSLANSGELRREDLCAEVKLKRERAVGFPVIAEGSVSLGKCTGNKDQKWSYDTTTQLIKHLSSGYCIHFYGMKAESLLTVAECDENDMYFKWIWEFISSPSGKTVANPKFK